MVQAFTRLALTASPRMTTQRRNARRGGTGRVRRRGTATTPQLSPTSREDTRDEQGRGAEGEANSEQPQTSSSSRDIHQTYVTLVAKLSYRAAPLCAGRPPTNL